MKKPERTPEEVKKGLMCCWKDGCADCPYDDDCEHSSSVYIARDALAYIQQLEADRMAWEDVASSPGAVEDMAIEVNRLQEELAAIKRERDAALADMKRYTNCQACKRWEESMAGKCTMKDDCLFGTIGRFEWRGVCPENTREDATE